MRFEVFGRNLVIERRGGRWVAHESAEGKRRLAGDIVIPSELSEQELAAYLADLLHERARPGHRTVRRLGMVITTRRLEIKPLLEADLPVLHEHWSVPEVGRWLWDDEVSTREQVAEELARSVDTFASRGFGIWGLHSRQAGDFLGTCGLLPVPEGTGEIEILFSVEPRWWRRGYAFEAATAVLRHGFEELGLDEIVGRCDVPNEPSRRLLERLGMRFERRAPIRGIDCLHYRLRRGE